MGKIHKGLSAARGQERLALLHAERCAISEVLQEYYWEKLQETRAVVYDLEGLDPISTQITWERRRGKLLVTIVVHLVGIQHRAVKKWRVCPKRGANSMLQGWAKRVLRERKA